MSVYPHSRTNPAWKSFLVWFGIVLSAVALPLPVLSDAATLAGALDTPDWAWLTNGVGWFPQTVVTHDGGASAQSGGTARGQTSSMETVVTGPGTVRFWWKASSTDKKDKLLFFVNDSEQKNLSGNKDWQLLTYALTSPGAQRLRWDYLWAGGSSATSATGWVDQVEFARLIDLAEALDAPALTWKTSGSPVWSGETNVTHDGVAAAQSGAIADGKSAAFTTAVTGPGTIYFWWKVSSETNGDDLLFQLGNGSAARISGEVDWAQAGPFMVPSGKQTLKWTYQKNGGGAAGADAGWVDQVLFIPPPPSITTSPSNQTAYTDATVVFAVTASGTALQYQWLRDGILLNDGAGISGASTAALTLASLRTNQTGGYSVVVSNPGGSVTSSVATLTVNYSLPLAEALDTPDRLWANITPVGWKGQTAISSDGADAAESGVIGNSQSTAMQTLAVGPGSVIFWWKVSSEAGKDILQFSLGGTELARISGESNWHSRTFSLPAGASVLKWTYSKNNKTAAGADLGWVDRVQFAGPLYQTNSNVLPGTNEIAAALVLANDYFIANNPRQTNGWARGVYQAGNVRAYQVLGTPRYYDLAAQWGNYFNWQPGWRGPTNADGEICGQAYLDLYRIDPQPVRLAAIKAAIDNRVAYVPVDDWWWIDAFFMAGPVYARLGNLYQTNSYFDKLFAMYQDTKVRRGLFDAADGLWYRDADAQSARTDNGKKQFWGRGNGWAIAACARVLEQSPLSAVQQAEYTAMLRRMAAALKPLQGADGFWRASLFDAAEVPNPETSGTALFTYALAWGIRNGVLDAVEYQPVVARAWNGLVRVALHGDGKVGYVQPSGRFPDKAGYEDTSDHGVGAFLLAGSEVFLLSALTPAAPSFETVQPWTDVPVTVSLVEDSVRLCWKTVPGRSYQILYKDDLSAEEWSFLDGEISYDDANAVLVDLTVSQSRRFYRVVEY